MYLHNNRNEKQNMMILLTLTQHLTINTNDVGIIDVIVGIHGPIKHPPMYIVHHL